MANRTNFVKISNLPPGYNNVMELFSTFSCCGVIQDMTAVDPTSVIISYSMRSGAENAAFAMSGVSLGGSTVAVTLYHTQSDPQFLTNPAYQGLGQYIGQDHHVMDPNTFKPWGAQTMPHPHQTPILRPPTLNLPNYSLGPGFGASLFQAMGSFVGSAQPAVAQPGTSHQPHDGGGGGGASAGSGGSSHQDILAKYTTPWVPPTSQQGDPPQCSICLLDLSDSSSYSSTTLAPVLTLVDCKHSFHSACLSALMANSPSPFLQCPTCKKVYGVRTGTRPTTGTMTHRLLRSSVPGHSGCGTIEMSFMFKAGIQGQEHPNPGQYYNPVGFPRTAFLPDNQEGIKALHGLYLAWEQRLLFTVGRSITTGMDNCVTWNDIHLKTKLTGGEHSFPDEHYLTNLAQDLAGFGITEAEISSHMGRYQGLRERGHL